MVFDDSPQREGEDVVRELADGRIGYSANPDRLGAAGNIDRAFRTGPLMGGALACVLEDDNWLLPNCLEENIREMERSDCPLLLRNQAVWKNGGPSCETTLGALYAEGRHEPAALHARLFFGLGIANGALFWRTDARTRLEVGPSVADTVLQEHCRTLQIEESAYFAAEPLAIWSAPQGEGKAIVPGPRRELSRGRQTLHARLWRRHGAALIPELMEIARHSGRQRRLDENLAYIGVRLPSVPLPQFLWWRAKSLARAITTPDPLAEYFGESGSPG